jgi:hypothetical protein
MSARAKMHTRTAFLNVDLDISSSQDLTSLAEALRPRLIVLHVGRLRGKHWARFELRTQPSNPDLAIRRLVAVIQRLPGGQRAYWKRATTRDFNIGIQAGTGPQSREFSVDPRTATMVGRIGGRIVITVYGASIHQSS